MGNYRIGGLSEWTWEGRQEAALRGINSEVNSLHSSMALAAREQREMLARLQAVRGSFEEQTQQTARQLVEFIDLRMELLNYLPAFQARRWATLTVARFLSGESATGTNRDGINQGGINQDGTEPGALDDVPGYWLPAAVTAVVSGASPTLALSRDPERTALLFVLVGMLSGQEQSAAAYLPQALPQLPVDRPVSTLERALWIAAANGQLGPAGMVLIETRLREALVSLTSAQRQAVLEQLQSRLRTGSVRGPRNIGSPAALEVAAALEAAETLKHLRELLSTPSDQASAPTSSANVSERPAALLRQALDDLIAEGSPEEAPTLGKLKQLRALIDGRTASAPESPLLQPAGSVLELLLDDLLPGTGTAVVSGMVTRRAMADLLIEVVNQLEERVRVEPPDSALVKLTGLEVLVNESGPDAQAMRVANTAIHDRTVREPQPNQARLITAAGIGVCLLGALSYPITAAMTFIGTVAGLALLWFGHRRSLSDRQEVVSAQLRRGEDLALLQDAVNNAISDLNTQRKLWHEARAQASDEANQVRQLLCA